MPVHGKRGKLGISSFSRREAASIIEVNEDMYVISQRVFASQRPSIRAVFALFHEISAQDDDDVGGNTFAARSYRS